MLTILDKLPGKRKCTDLPNLLQHILIGQIYIGASVAQWSERSPFTPEAADPIPRENFPNVTRTTVNRNRTRIQCSIHAKRASQHSAEISGFSPGAPVSFDRKLTGWVRTQLGKQISIVAKIASLG